MTATKIALLVGVAALAGCSSTSESSNTDSTSTGGITQAVARGFVTNPAGTATTVNLANARNGEQVTLNVTDAVAATQTDPAVPGSATLSGAGSSATAALTLEEFGSVTAANARVGTDLTTRFYGTAAASSTAAAPQFEAGTDTLEVIDAEYARIALASTAPTAANNQQANRAFIVGPKADDVARDAPTGGTATYRGQAYGVQLTPNAATDLGGEVELRADFGASTIEGEIAIDGSPVEVRLRNGQIDGVDYSGGLTIVDTSGASTYAVDGRQGNERGAFRGGFYGPNSEETVGVVDFKGTVTDTTTNTTQNLDATGNFIATKR